MQNGTDLSQADKLIQRYTADAQDARRRADLQRMRSAEITQGDDPGSAQYFEQEAFRYDQKANEYEEQVDQLQSQKTQLESRLHELENQRAKEEADHMERLRLIDQEIARIRG